LATPGTGIADCRFRMITPGESALAQRVPAAYQITSNESEQQIQAGNAVSSNLSQWLGGLIVRTLA